MKCENNMFGWECKQFCPTFKNITCSGRGTCDDGNLGTGVCICENFAFGEACENVYHINNSTIQNITNFNITSINATNATNANNLTNAIKSGSTTTSTGLIDVNPFGNGGGLALLASVSSTIATISLVLLKNNTADAGGGGLYMDGSTLVAVMANQNSVSIKAERNKAKFGGNVFLSKSSFNTTLHESTPKATMKSMYKPRKEYFTFHNATASNDGGAFACIGSTLHLEGTDVAHNQASYRGGGIYGVLVSGAIFSTSNV